MTNPPLTAADLLEVMAYAFGAATATVTATHAAPPEVTATPAIVLRPGSPWLTPNRRIATCTEVHWQVQLLAGRYDLAATLDQLCAGYPPVVRALHAAGVGQVGPLDNVGPVEVAGVPTLAASFNVTLPLAPTPGGNHGQLLR